MRIDEEFRERREPVHADLDTILSQAREREATMLAGAEALPLPVAEMRQMVRDRIESSAEAKEAINQTRREIVAAQLGLSQKGVLVAGPCSPDDRLLDDGRAPAFEVPLALHTSAQAHNANVVHVPRICWKKPRSSVGSPGLYHQAGGAEFALREIYLPLIERGIPFAYELLDPDDPLQNAASYAWAGARSVGHNPLWYAMAANPTCPVGLKNSESGGLSKIKEVAAAIRDKTAVTVSLPEKDAHVVTAGNHFVNAIYRGGELNDKGLTDPAEIREAFQVAYMQVCRDAYLAYTRIMLDCSHGNAKLFTGGRRDEQGQLDCFSAFEELALDNPVVIAAGELNAPRDITVLDMTMGVMAEVYLLPGRNEPGQPPMAGRSDVDACLGLEHGLELQQRLAAIYATERSGGPIWHDHPALTTKL